MPFVRELRGDQVFNLGIKRECSNDQPNGNILRSRGTSLWLQRDRTRGSWPSSAVCVHHLGLELEVKLYDV